MHAFRPLFALVSLGATFGIAFSFPACIQLGPSNDESADGGMEPPTVQAQCMEVMAAFCSRANECFGEDPNACFEPAVKACCEDACAKPATSTQHSIHACVLDIGKEDCDDVLLAQLPPRCKKVVTHD